MNVKGENRSLVVVVVDVCLPVYYLYFFLLFFVFFPYLAEASVASFRVDADSQGMARRFLEISTLVDVFAFHPVAFKPSATSTKSEKQRKKEGSKRREGREERRFSAPSLSVCLHHL